MPSWGSYFVGSGESCEAFKQGSDNIRTVLQQDKGEENQGKLPAVRDKGQVNDQKMIAVIRRENEGQNQGWDSGNWKERDRFEQDFGSGKKIKAFHLNSQVCRHIDLQYIPISNHYIVHLN